MKSPQNSQITHNSNSHIHNWNHTCFVVSLYLQKKKKNTQKMVTDSAPHITDVMTYAPQCWECWHCCSTPYPGAPNTIFLLVKYAMSPLCLSSWLCHNNLYKNALGNLVAGERLLGSRLPPIPYLFSCTRTGQSETRHKPGLTGHDLIQNFKHWLFKLTLTVKWFLMS